jgi:hypothetical protein
MLENPATADMWNKDWLFGGNLLGVGGGTSMIPTPKAEDGAGGGGGGGAGNQFFSQLPSMPVPGNTLSPTNTPSAPGIVPPTTTPTGAFPSTANTGRVTTVGSGTQVGSTFDPAFTQAFGQWLASQMGAGATPFNLQAEIPSSGGATEAGKLTAPLTGILNSLQEFYRTGKGGPTGSQAVAEAAGPTSAIPEWQKMVDAMQRSTKEGEANLREQFAFSGNLSSSPFGNAMTDYWSQTTKDREALLANLENQYATRRLEAGTTLLGGATGLGEILQGLDQQSIDRLLNEFLRTRPEYSPLLNAQYGYATTFPPYMTKNYGVGALGATLAGAGTAAKGIADIISVLKK